MMRWGDGETALVIAWPWALVAAIGVMVALQAAPWLWWIFEGVDRALGATR